MSVHARHGVGCLSCHDQSEVKGTAWMAYVSNPPMKQDCKTCHTVQADVFKHTDTHSNLDCTACHMPNMPKPAEYSEDQAKIAGTALYRTHMYKINPSPDKTSYVKKEVKVDGKTVSQYELAKDEKGRDFVDLMWSCARNAPADWTVFEGKGCHSQYTSKLEEGLVYKDQKQVYGELVKWQNPVKEGYKEIRGATERINKLLEVTRLDRDQRTQVLSYVDLATQIADMIEKDGSWGAHAHNYMTQRLAAAQNYVRKAQEILDAGKFSKTAVDPLSNRSERPGIGPRREIMTIDRRKFLAGTALGAVTAVLLNKQEAKAGNVSGYKPRFAMIFDQNKCVGCGACKEACSETNHVPAGQLRMTLERQSPLDGTPGNRKYVRVSCQQCSEPPCVRVCPTGAAHIDPATNIVTMDNSRCVGCKYCIAGCPYNVRFINEETKAAENCDFCLHTKLAIGEQPACVQACRYDALVFGDTNDPNSYISKMLAVKNSVRVRAVLGTHPNLHYIPKLKEEV